jgi:FMN-dependent NADH-azoreductase
LQDYPDNSLILSDNIMKILHLDSCALGNDSASRRFTAQVVAALVADNAAPVEYRDLAATSLSHVSAPLLQVMRGHWDASLPMNAELQGEVLQAEVLLQEFLEADVIVLGAPMYNFAMPSRLKSWLDRILQAGRTYNVSSPAARAMLKNKQVLIVSSMCSHMGVSHEMKLLDSHELHLQTVFSTMGIERIKAIRTDQWNGHVETFNEWCEDLLEAA